jgi:L-fuculose-phosphate aldolase
VTPPNDQERALRQELVEVGRRLAEKDLVPGTDGNLSVRLGSEWLLTTPSGVSKGALHPDQIVKCDLDGNPVGELKPSSEIRMHVLVYRARPDVAAAVHAHPAHAVALSLAGVSLAECLLPEPTLALGAIPTAPYATPTTEDVPESIRELLTRRFNALILARHGTLTLGRTLDEAVVRLETLEHTARITAIARSVGGASLQPLPASEVERIEGIARALGIARPSTSCSLCGTCGSKPHPPARSQPQPATPSPASRPHPPTPSPAPRRRGEEEARGDVTPLRGAGEGPEGEALVATLVETVLRRLGHDRVAGDTSSGRRRG